MKTLQHLRILILTLLIGSLFPNTSFAQSDSSRSVSTLEQKILGLMNELEDEGKIIEILASSDLKHLPVMVQKKIHGKPYSIAFDSSRVRVGQGRVINAYATIPFPGTNETLVFWGKNLSFHSLGLRLSSGTRLALASQHKIKINEKVDLVLPAGGQSYVEFDCEGFKSVKLSGYFRFDPDMIVPDEDLIAQTRNQSLNEVRASFEVETSDMNNILASVSISPFQITGLGGISFAVEKATVDMSDLVNPDGYVFPPSYQQMYGANLPLWRGFYLEKITVALPPELTPNRGRIQIQAENLLIDETGVSGSFRAINLLSLSEGSLSGWPFSVDAFGVTLLHNKLIGGGLAGEITIPFLGDQALGYEAEMEQRDGEVNYRFGVVIPENREFNTPFSATIKLERGSTIGFEKQEGKLIPQALLHGTLSVDHKLLKIPELRFENLGLQGKKPYLVSGGFALSGNGQSRLANFPLRIDSVRLGIYQGNLSLGMGVVINLENKEDKPFGAETFVQILAKVEERTQGSGDSERTVQKWVFDKVLVNDILTESYTKSFEMKGRLSFFQDDPVYGNGFRGRLGLKIGSVLPYTEVGGYFGSKEDFRYWQLDVHVPTKKIPIVAPALYLNGIKGGMAYRMRRKTAFAPDFARLNGDEDKEEDKTVSGLVAHNDFIPDGEAGYTFLAGATLIGPTEKAFNSDMVFDIALRRGGGIKYIQFLGHAYFMQDLKARARGKEADVNAPMYAYAKVLFDSDNRSFHANMQSYLNVAGVLRGTGTGNRLGEAVMHFDPNDWYIYLGRPRSMNGVDIFGLAQARGYFMVGTQVEDLPLPPYEVQSLFEGIDLDFMRDENALSSGRGFATGLHFNANFDKGLGFVYARMNVGGGLDVMLRSYRNAYCKGREGKNIGINGWYASGQAYAFLDGEIGLQFGKKKKNGEKKRFPIASLGAAALLQAKAPNPTLLKGRLAGRFRILGGLVKGKFNVGFTIGEECELAGIGNELGDIEVIADIAPDGGSREVSVFTAPQVSFNVAIGEDLRLVNNENNLHTYRVILDEAILMDENNTQIPAELIWNESKDVLVVKTPDILPETTTLNIKAKVHWEKKENGRWEALKAQGQVDYETKEVNFLTGTAPDYIPEENIAFSYPVKSQYNFHSSEHPSGYIQLKWGQPNVFRPSDEMGEWRYEARFEAQGKKALTTSLAYDSKEKRVYFNLPSAGESENGELSKETVYNLSLLRKPKNTQNIDANLNQGEREISSSDSDNNSVSVRDNQLDGNILQGDLETALYTLHFRTSKYETFASKFEAMKRWKDVVNITTANTLILGKRANARETLDVFELKGSSDSFDPLVQVTASPETPWFEETIYPWLYELYPQAPEIRLNEWRVVNTNEEIAPLSKGVRWENTSGDFGSYKLSSEQAQNGLATTRSGDMFLGYYMSFYSYFDYDELRNKAAALYLEGNRSEGVMRLLGNKEGYSQSFVDLSPGKYPVSVKYVLPGTNQVTTEKNIIIKY